MGPPAARVGDMHTCPLVNGLVPHVGGPVLPPCSINVFTCGPPQARVTDKCVCVGPPDVIMVGSASVFVNNLNAARVGDNTVHGGVIVSGAPSVYIGGAPVGMGAGSAGGAAAGAGGGPMVSASSLSNSGGQARAMKEAAKSGAPIVERCS